MFVPYTCGVYPVLTIVVWADKHGFSYFYRLLTYAITFHRLIIFIIFIFFNFLIFIFSIRSFIFISFIFFLIFIIFSIRSFIIFILFALVADGIDLLETGCAKDSLQWWGLRPPSPSAGGQIR